MRGSYPYSGGENISRWTMRLELAAKRRPGRATSRRTDEVKEDEKSDGFREDSEDRMKWRVTINCVRCLLTFSTTAGCRIVLGQESCTNSLFVKPTDAETSFVWKPLPNQMYVSGCQRKCFVERLRAAAIHRRVSVTSWQLPCNSY